MPGMYLPKKIELDGKKYPLEERFFREGESTKEVQEQLDIFQYGKGRWRITPADDEEGEGPSTE